MKKLVFQLRSVNNIVKAAANTGNDSTNNIAVNRTDQTNKGTRYIVMPCARIFKIVTIKLIDPNIEAIPETCKLKIAKSTDGPE